MPKKKKVAALALPDALLVRYFRQGEIQHVARVTLVDDVVAVKLTLPAGGRIDTWRDLGGGLGFVPATPES